MKRLQPTNRCALAASRFYLLTCAAQRQCTLSRGDRRAYRLVRDHFAILAEAIERNSGAIVKTIGDAVMVSFGSGGDAVRAAFESQAELCARAANMGGELVLKAGVHAGACLAVKLNNRLDFFGGAVNTAARVQGLSRGNDVLVTDEVIADIERKEMTTSDSFALRRALTRAYTACQSRFALIDSSRQTLEKRLCGALTDLWLRGS